LGVAVAESESKSTPWPEILSFVATPAVTGPTVVHLVSAGVAGHVTDFPATPELSKTALPAIFNFEFPLVLTGPFDAHFTMLEAVRTNATTSPPSRR
jgi:hypothetical protein